jgi:UDP-N-acetylglucosamine 2-epimerase (non-hydrolysing)
MSEIKTVLCVFGTRPEAVKMAPVVIALKRLPTEFRCRVIVTAQHRRMLDDVLRLFEITPDFDLNIMTPGQTLTAVTARVLRGLETVLASERPDMMLVHGDTTTTMAAALAAFYQRIPVGHVEAGLRSFDQSNPFPEELNRLLADRIAQLHFAPTPRARENLEREGISPDGIVVTGNTGIDALRLVLPMVRRDEFLPTTQWRPSRKESFVLVTAHRRENFGAPLAAICQAIRQVSVDRPHVHFVYPVHPNPNVNGPVNRALCGLPNVHLLPPLDYGEFLHLLFRARFVVTDSGGLQEEGPSLGKPVLVLREVTERPEAVLAGTVKVIGTETDSVKRWIVRLLEDQPLFERMANAVNPYGDGRAAHRTVEAIRRHFRFRRTKISEFHGGSLSQKASQLSRLRIVKAQTTA